MADESLQLIVSPVNSYQLFIILVLFLSYKPGYLSSLLYYDMMPDMLIVFNWYDKGLRFLWLMEVNN